MAMPASYPTPPLNSPDGADEALDAAVILRASEWLARLGADDASDADRAACARWRAEHPKHELAWNRLNDCDGRLRSLPRDVARHALRESASGARQGRRRLLQLLGLGVVVGGVAYAVRGTQAWQLATAAHSTATGDIRDLTLPDGTRVVLASASAIDVRFDDNERLLVLRAGQILVTTAPDPALAARPFRVRGRDGVVQALGTRFSLRQDDATSSVAVFEGAVEVRPTYAGSSPTRVDAGQGATFNADRVQAPEAVPDSDAAWTRGMLVADNMRLDDLVAELARYRSGHLACDPAVGDLRVNGIFPLRDTDRALHNLTLALPVAISRHTRYWVTVLPAQ